MQWVGSETSTQGISVNLEAGLRFKTVRPLLAIPFLTFVPFSSIAQDQLARAWLDTAPVQWNRGGGHCVEAPKGRGKKYHP
jgi:hypothetical protein